MKHALMLVVAATLAVAGCGDSTGPSSEIVGTYTLRTVSGSNLPVVIAGVEVLAGQVVLKEDGTFMHSFTTRPAGGGTSTIEPSSGTYAVSGSQITFTDSEHLDVVVATIADNTITVSQFEADLGMNVTTVYRK
jgi:hypothetical protein